MGRLRLPLSEQKGDLTQERRAKLEAEQEIVETPKRQIIRAPKWLSERGKDEYRRLLKIINEMKNNMLGDLDTNNLAAYCNAFDKYLIAEQEIKDKGLTVETEKGPVINPSVYLQIKYAKEMRDFGRQCGLSIDSRLKFAAAKMNEIESGIEEEFGDI